MYPNDKWLFQYNKTIEKRYAVVFDMWQENKFLEEVEQFDTLEEVAEYESLIVSTYCTTKHPVKEKVRGKKYNYTRLNWEGGACYWGYVVLDFQEEMVMKFEHDGLKFSYTTRPSFNSKNRNEPKVKDYFFRKIGEVPNNYQWDDGEYEGWLRFRWGDGKNSLTYKKEYKPKKKKEVNAIEFSEADVIEDEFDKEIVNEASKRRMDKFGW